MARKKKKVNLEEQLLQERAEKWYEENLETLVKVFKSRVDKFNLDEYIKEFILNEFNNNDKCLATVERYDSYGRYTRWELIKIDNYDINNVYDEDADNFLSQVYESSLGFGFSPVSYMDRLWEVVEEELDNIICSLIDLIPIEFRDIHSIDLTLWIRDEDEVYDFIREYLDNRLTDDEYVNSFKKYVK